MCAALKNGPAPPAGAERYSNEAAVREAGPVIMYVALSPGPNVVPLLVGKAKLISYLPSPSALNALLPRLIAGLSNVPTFVGPEKLRLETFRLGSRLKSHSLTYSWPVRLRTFKVS